MLYFPKEGQNIHRNTCVPFSPFLFWNYPIYTLNQNSGYSPNPGTFTWQTTTTTKTEYRSWKGLKSTTWTTESPPFSYVTMKAHKLEGNCPRPHQWQSLGQRSSSPGTQDQRPSPHSMDPSRSLNLLNLLNCFYNQTVSSLSQLEPSSYLNLLICLPYHTVSSVKAGAKPCSLFYQQPLLRVWNTTALLNKWIFYVQVSIFQLSDILKHTSTSPHQSASTRGPIQVTSS